jgi:hypothetical protein
VRDAHQKQREPRVAEDAQVGHDFRRQQEAEHASVGRGQQDRRREQAEGEFTHDGRLA